MVGNGVEKRVAEEKTNEPPEKKRRILEKIHYEDLEAGNEDAEIQELKLSKVSNVINSLICFFFKVIYPT